MSFHTVRRLERQELIQLVDNILHPKGRGLSSQEITDQLNLVCANCPDPAAAMDIIIEAMPPITAKELVDRVLTCPPRDVSTVSTSELPPNHPLRALRVE
jgi:hypothetical protein